MKKRSKRIVRLSFYCLYLIICFGLYEHVFVYHVKFNGKAHEIININSNYEDPGILVKLRGKALTDITSEGSVDANKFGVYKIKYFFANKVKERIVEVRDIEKPIIKLNESDITINYKAKYKEPGYTASDNFDGDLTDSVIVVNGVNPNELGEYYINYIVRDSSNNETMVSRKVIVDDTEGPIIKFNNYYDFAIKGHKKDFKYIASDNIDGLLSDKVNVSGLVDFNKEGIYTLTYSVKDSHNNETKVERKINIQEKNTKGIPVLMYHWFYDDTKGETTEGEANRHNYISKTEIIKQVKYLKESGFYFPSWQELIDYIDGKIDLPKKSVIITDDDCTNTFFNIALPVFQEYEVPVTSFCISKKTNYQKFLGAKYLDFQSHTNDMHQRICNTYWDGAVMCASYNDIYEDIKLSIKKLGSSYAFAYPFGHYSDDTIKALKNNGIKLAFTIHEGRVKRNANKYLLPRVRISSWTDIDTYKTLVN